VRTKAGLVSYQVRVMVSSVLTTLSVTVPLGSPSLTNSAEVTGKAVSAKAGNR
jgi:hypothetical protein